MAKFLVEPTPNAEAADFIASKPALTRSVFDQLLPELKARAFTVAGIEHADTLQRVRDIVAELPAGGDWNDLKGQIIDEVSPYFVTATDPEERAKQEYGAERRAELLLRTHGQQAYAAASYKVMDAQRANFPLWQYQTLGDSRVRDTHAALDKIVMPADSPFWATHFPPWDWGCRCQAIPISDDDAADIRQADKQRPTEARQMLDVQDQHRLETQHVIVRHADPAAGKGGPVPFFVQSPAEQGKPGAFSWHPGSLKLSLKDLEAKYDKPVFAAFEKWAKTQPIPEKKMTVWEWLQGHGTVAPHILPPGSPAALPAQPQPPTVADLLTKLGLDKKLVWTESDVASIMAGLKKTGAVKAKDKIDTISGSALEKKGVFSDKGLRKALRGLLKILPKPVIAQLPKFSIEVGADNTLGASLGYYDSTSRTLWLNHSKLSIQSKESQLETVWHEMMHWVHMHGPQEYRDAIADHFAARTQGEKVHQLPGYGSGVRGKEDKFYSAYAGRIYPFEDPAQPGGLEIPTRYFQLFANPEKFLRQMDANINQYAAGFLETVKIVLSIFLESKAP